jgi:hypothetical protein
LGYGEQPTKLVGIWSHTGRNLAAAGA